MTPEAAIYLEEALAYIQLQALQSARLDWHAIRSEALDRAQDAQTSADTYPTLRWVLSRLGDRHSFLASPQDVQQRQAGRTTSLGILAVYPEGVIVTVQPNSPACAAGLQLRDIIETINNKPTAQFNHITFKRALYAPSASLAIRRAGQVSISSVILHATSYQREMKPQGWLLGPGIGYLELPGVAGGRAITKAYAVAAQSLIRNMARLAVFQWVIDLRRNTGGNMWPMLAGVSPLLGECECGFFVSAEGKRTNWLPTLATQTRAFLRKSYRLKHPVAAIAVLTSHLTCSSGESITLAFRGRPQTRSFGESTAGLPTANQSKTLQDGAQLFLTVALCADRTGHTYNSPLVPDQAVTSDWTLFQTERDPVLLAALEWLRT